MKGIGVKGTYYDGLTSGRHASELIVDEDHRVHIHGVPFSPCQLDQIDIPSRIGNTARLIRLPNGNLFETSDNEGVDRISQLANTSKPAFNAHHWESKLSFIVITLIIFIAATYGAITKGIPAASKLIANHLPEYISTSLAEGTLEQLDDWYLKPSKLNKARQAHYQNLFSKWTEDIKGPPLHLKFRFSNVLGANAFALPNGDIIVTDSLIEMAENDQEIIAVIFHEVGHIIEHHSLRQALESTGTTAILIWLTGDVEGIANLILSAPLLFVHSGYSRSHETEADTYALESLIAADIDPIHFATIMNKLSKEPTKKPRKQADTENKTNQNNQELSIWHYLSTHPPSDHRVERFQRASDEWHKR